MKTKHIKIFKCPYCFGELMRTVLSDDSKDILNGELSCKTCDKKYPINRGIPRFVGTEHYSSSFGFEWNKHSFTQYDSCSEHNLSKKRLDKEVKWPEKMREELILEAGYGSGRFTEHLLKTGATIFSVDVSVAVDENFKNHKEKDNFCVAQADIISLPFKQESFDKVLCIGVLQHTPNPFLSFKALVSALKRGGEMVAHIYDKPPFYKRIFNTRHWMRPITKRLPPAFLHKIVTTHVNIVWPFAKLIHKLPFGVKINHKLLIAEYLSYKNLTQKEQKEWAVLDTFDWLSPTYEFSQTVETVKKWCKELPLKDVEIKYGYGGIEIRAVRV